MRFDSVVIESIGWVLPQNIVTSSELEDMFGGTLQRLGLPKGQLERLSGVKERRYWDAGVQPSVVAAMAGQQALDNAGVGNDQIDAVINTSVCRDYLEPATAALVMGRMGFPGHTIGFDIANACLGFVHGVWLAANMIELGQARRVLVVDGEQSHDVAMATVDRLSRPDATADDFRENFASLTLGSGAVAAVITRESLAKAGSHKVNGVVHRTASQHSTLCLGNATQMRSDPHGLLVHGCALAVETWPLAAEAFGWTPNTVDEYICHQVSLAHFQTVMQKLELPMDRALLTFPFLGNVGPASIPLTLAMGVAQGRITEGQELCLFGVGSGLGCIMMGVSW